MAVAKPRNLREQAQVEHELRKKYPQMYNADGSLKAAYGGKKKKKKKTSRTESVESGLRRGGLTESEISRLRD